MPRGFQDPAMLAAPLRERLAGLANPPSQAERDAVRMQIADYAQGLKAIDWDGERVVVAVLQIAREAGMTTSSAVVSDSRLAGTDKLLVDMVDWAIEEYDHGEPF